GHMWQEEGWGYALFPDRESLTQRFEDFLSAIREAVETSGLSAAVYTQTTDIETENNGLMTYDREIVKIDAEAISLASRGYLPPRIVRRAPIFLDRTLVEFAPALSDATIRYTIDGSAPSVASRQYEGAFEITASTTVKSRAFWQDGTASRVSTVEYTRAEAHAAEAVEDLEPGLLVEYFEQDGSWRELPEFESLNANNTTVAQTVDLVLAPSSENFGLRFRGFVNVPADGVYGFHVTSDDGSRLFVDGEQVVDNDGVHGARERSGYVALEAGKHPIELVFFQGRGGVALTFEYDGPGFEKRVVEGEVLFH
ncbi:PA14 domain-containing protein, partial [Gemmatimonadota bacterium]